MGWQDCHLFNFTIDHEHYNAAAGSLSKPLCTLSLGIRSTFHYEYDFGDGWNHKILVEKKVPRVTGVHYPVCIAGRRA